MQIAARLRRSRGRLAQTDDARRIRQARRVGAGAATAALSGTVMVVEVPDARLRCVPAAAVRIEIGAVQLDEQVARIVHHHQMAVVLLDELAVHPALRAAIAALAFEMADRGSGHRPPAAGRDEVALVRSVDVAVVDVLRLDPDFAARGVRAGVDERIAESDLEMVAQSPAAAALDRADDRARFRRRGNAGDVFVPDAVTGKEIGGAASGPPTARTTAGRGSRGRRAAI